ncbi:hypothetical protein KKF34_04545, partial [Myxococcota bacterium]|nr:hypothetical protein [Myxococcota bacterium]
AKHPNPWIPALKSNSHVMAAHSGNKLSISLENIDHRLFSLFFRLDKSAFLEYFSNNAMRRASTLSITESSHCSAAGGFCPEIEGDAWIGEVESVSPEKSSAFPATESPVSTASAFRETENSMDKGLLQ